MAGTSKLYVFHKEKQEDRRKERSDRDAMDEVFDRQTLLAAGRLVTRGLFTTVDFSISTGKVANIFRVTSDAGPRALKVYRIGNAVYRKMPPYLLHELREEVGSNSFGRIVFAWARREFMALKACHRAGVPVPEPIDYHRNLILMEFLGVNGFPYPTLMKCKVSDPEIVLERIMKAVRTMVVKARLVHGDLSPYNILCYENKIAIIDMGETLECEHPAARGLLMRDAENFAKYFNRSGIAITGEEMFRGMGGDEL